MAAQPNTLAVVSPRPNNHLYHANAAVFRARLEEPIKRTVEKQALVELSSVGGYEYRRADPLRIDGLISYGSGYTQVAGNPSAKHGGVSTLATSVVEDLNVLDVLTADRVVGQIFTEHPEYGKGQVPTVTFLGTRFDNLRIAGHKVEIEPHLDILGPKPKDDESYFKNSGVFSRIAQQYSNIKRVVGLPAWASDQFHFDESEIQENNEMKCSLVNNVEGAPGTSFGHVIDLPFFGKIILGELTVKRVPGNGISAEGIPYPDTYSFHLTMIKLKLGCPVEGDGEVAPLDTNGGGKSTPPPPPIR
jgi:hypothetical protein